MPAFSLWPLRVSLANIATEQHMFGMEYNRGESIEQWNCPYCFKIMSSSRPPVFNSNNCGCAEAGTLANGDDDDEQSLARDYEQRILHDPARYYQRSRSSTSSSISISCPEGPERQEPNLDFGNIYLPLGPDVGLNETQHRRSASIHSDMSYQMRRFLVDAEPGLPHPAETSAAGAKFLPQGIHIQSQNLKAAKKRSKPSYQSISSGSVDANFYFLGGDPAVAVGAQFDQVGILEIAGGYPMTMSGMSVSRSEQ